MMREHVAAWVTVAFAVLLVVLAASDQSGGSPGASFLILAWAALLVALFVAVEHAVRQHNRI